MVVPCPISDASVISPPRLRIIERTWARPMPSPGRPADRAAEQIEHPVVILPGDAAAIVLDIHQDAIATPLAER